MTEITIPVLPEPELSPTGWTIIHDRLDVTEARGKWSRTWIVGESPQIHGLMPGDRAYFCGALQFEVTELDGSTAAGVKL